MTAKTNEAKSIAAHYAPIMAKTADAHHLAAYGAVLEGEAAPSVETVLGFYNALYRLADSLPGYCVRLAVAKVSGSEVEQQIARRVYRMTQAQKVEPAIRAAFKRNRAICASLGVDEAKYITEAKRLIVEGVIPCDSTWQRVDAAMTDMLLGLHYMPAADAPAVSPAIRECFRRQADVCKQLDIDEAEYTRQAQRMVAEGKLAPGASYAEAYDVLWGQVLFPRLLKKTDDDPVWYERSRQTSKGALR